MFTNSPRALPTIGKWWPQWMKIDFNSENLRSLLLVCSGLCPTFATVSFIFFSCTYSLASRYFIIHLILTMVFWNALSKHAIIGHSVARETAQKSNFDGDIPSRETIDGIAAQLFRSGFPRKFFPFFLQCVFVASIRQANWVGFTPPLSLTTLVLSSPSSVWENEWRTTWVYFSPIVSRRGRRQVSNRVVSSILSESRKAADRTIQANEEAQQQTRWN